MSNEKTSDGKVIVASTQRKVPLTPAFKGQIEKLVRFVARREGKRIAEVDIAIVGARRMARLNEQYLGHAGATDALSFDLDDDKDSVFAQLIVCSDVAIKQSLRRGHSPQVELLLYIVHALLHAMGYEDQTKADAVRMHMREDELLREFGIGAVFNV